MKKRIWYYFLPSVALLLLWGAFRLGQLQSVPVGLTAERTIVSRQTAMQPGQKPSVTPDVVEQTVCINTASAEELEFLPGIGPVLAQRIVEDRELNGPFSTKEALLRVNGIGEKTLDAITDYITLE